MFPLLLGSHTSYPASDSTNPKLPFDRLIRKLSEAPVSPCWSTTTPFVADKYHWKGNYAIKLYQKVILRWSTSLRVLSGLWFYSVSVPDREPINHHSSPVLFTLHTMIWRCLRSLHSPPQPYSYIGGYITGAENCVRSNRLRTYLLLNSHRKRLF